MKNLSSLKFGTVIALVLNVLSAKSFAQTETIDIQNLARTTVENYISESLPAYMEFYRLENQDQNMHAYAVRYDWSSDNDWIDDHGKQGTDFSGSSSNYFARGNYVFRDQTINPSEYSEIGGRWTKRNFDVTVKNQLTEEQGRQVQACVASGDDFESKSPEECRRDLGFKDLSMAYQYFDFDAHFKMEGNQDFSQRNYVFGVEANYSRSTNTHLIIHPTLTLGIEQVDPAKDEVRLALLNEEETYSRGYAKISFTSKLADIKGHALKLNVSSRYFKELSPDAAIENAELDEFSYTAIALQIPAALIPGFDNTANSFILSYSKGKLPFNRAEEKTFELGFRHNINFDQFF